MINETNWATNVTYSANDIVRPQSIEQLREVLQNTASAKALGSRHSFNRIADTSGTLISTQALAFPPELDATRQRVRVAPGARYGDIGRWLDDRGWALANLASLPHISVAGAISTGTHGSGQANQSLAGAVNAVEIMTAEGDHMRFGRGNADFAGAVVSLGALGVITAVELDIEPTYDVSQTVYEALPLDAVLDNFSALQHGAYSVSLFTTLQNPGVIDQIWYKSRVEGTHTPPSVLTGHEAPSARHPLPGVDATSCTEQGGNPGRWLDRLPHFRLEHTPSHGDELQSEYLLPLRHARNAIAAIHELAPQIAPLLFVSEIRTVAADTLWLSPAYGAETLAFHFTWRPDSAAVAAVLPLIEAALAPFGARPHWGKVFTPALAARIHELYPQWHAFTDLRASMDPRGVFSNAFLDEVGS